MSIALVISVSGWAVAQVIKVLIVLLKDRHLDFRYFVSSGGMPSAHSATVCALATAVAKIDGFNSVAFGITAILAMIVMYDSAGVRQSVSRQSIVLNRIVKELQMRHRLRSDMERELRVLIGHTPFQVIVGAAVGILVAWVWLTVST